MSMRYFQIEPDAYEATRLQLDAARALPAPMTVYAPLADAPRAGNGHALIAVRAEHAARPEFAAPLAQLIAHGHCLELNLEQWTAEMPPQPTFP